jgi:flagellar motility protein MotE (MotC chaperone)
MKPARAAAIFNNLPDEVLIPVAQGMKPGDLGAILAAMNSEAAQRLTVKLANRLALPQTADAVGPQVQPAAPTAPAAPAPQKTQAQPKT